MGPQASGLSAQHVLASRSTVDRITHNRAHRKADKRSIKKKGGGRQEMFGLDGDNARSSLI